MLGASVNDMSRCVHDRIHACRVLCNAVETRLEFILAMRGKRRSREACDLTGSRLGILLP